MNKKINNEKVNELVLRLNEIHHDYLEHGDYDKDNSVMHQKEKNNWKEIFKKYNFENSKVLEIGTGTGFVPSIAISNSVKIKFYTCTDISEKILDIAQKKISNFKTKIKFDYKKLSDKNLPFEDNSFDYILLNSVLHHIPETDYFFKEISRILKKNGHLIIGHEPNIKFYENPILNFNFLVLSKSLNFLGKVKNSFGKNSEKKWVKEANKILLEEKLIYKKLSEKELCSFIDFHGFGINYKKKPKNLTIKYLKTSNYLGTLSFAYNNFLWRFFVNIYESIFSVIFKKSGFTYFIVYKNNK